MHLKLHLPEKLSCFKVSPNGHWAAGGSPTGHIYLWEVSRLQNCTGLPAECSCPPDYSTHRSRRTTGQ